MHTFPKPRPKDIKNKTLLTQWGKFIIWSNPERYELIVTAHKDNWEPVMVNGTPLWSKETKGFEVTEDVTITGKVGEKVYVSEILYLD